MLLIIRRMVLKYFPCRIFSNKRDTCLLLKIYTKNQILFRNLSPSSDKFRSITYLIKYLLSTHIFCAGNNKLLKSICIVSLRFKNYLRGMALHHGLMTQEIYMDSEKIWKSRRRRGGRKSINNQIYCHDDDHDDDRVKNISEVSGFMLRILQTTKYFICFCWKNK